MKEKYTFTKEQLTQAFNKWNEDYLNDESQFLEDTKAFKDGQAQAVTLLSYLIEAKD